MVAQLIDGKALAAKVRKEIAAEIKTRKAEGRRQPGLAVILVGDDPASEIYVRNKRLACEEVGIICVSPLTHQNHRNRINCTH